MIIELLLSPFWGLIDLIINLLPSAPSSAFSLGNFVSIVSKGMIFINPVTFVLVISNVLFWASIHFGWAIVEWVYKKIPGVD